MSKLKCTFFILGCFALNPTIAYCQTTQNCGSAANVLVYTKAVHPFSVSASKKVIFSPGNLQYHLGDSVFRFAPHQYDILGEENTKVGDANYTGWIDLFGWMTSGYCGYYPTMISMDSSSYHPEIRKGDVYELDKYLSWGEFNEIHYTLPNTNVEVKWPRGSWRLLSEKEVNYLFNQRRDYFFYATIQKMIEGVAVYSRGIVLLPDDWDFNKTDSYSPTYDPTFPLYEIDFTTYQNGKSCKSPDGKSECYYTEAQWKKFEDDGAVFLPAAGFRRGTKYFPYVEQFAWDHLISSYIKDTVSSVGYYWTSFTDTLNYNPDIVSPKRPYGVYCLRFYEYFIYPPNYGFRNFGMSVRLVRDY